MLQRRGRKGRDMTKVILDMPDDGSIMFDCINHAGNHDACTIMATLCNVLVEETFRLGDEPVMYEPGHVRIDLHKADEIAHEVFETVFEVMKQAARQQPDHIKIQ